MAARTAYKRRAGEGIELPPETVARSIAPFESLEPDPDAFRDANNPDLRLGIRFAPQGSVQSLVVMHSDCPHARGTRRGW